MSAEAHLPQLSDQDYATIEAAVMETVRGRWFLAEYAKRNRNADTEKLLDALTRIEESFNSNEHSGMSDMDRMRKNLIEMSMAISKTRREISSLTPSEKQKQGISAATAELDSIVHATEQATEMILEYGEKIQATAWAMHEEGAPEDDCEAIKDLVSEIFTTCSFQDLMGQRTSRVVNLLKYLERRINSMIEIWGGGDALAKEIAALENSEADQVESAQEGMDDSFEPVPVLVGDSSDPSLSQGDIDEVIHVYDLVSSDSTTIPVEEDVDSEAMQIEDVDAKTSEELSELTRHHKENHHTASHAETDSTQIQSEYDSFSSLLDANGADDATATHDAPTHETETQSATGYETDPGAEVDEDALHIMDLTNEDDAAHFTEEALETNTSAKMAETSEVISGETDSSFDLGHGTSELSVEESLEDDLAKQELDSIPDNSENMQQGSSDEEVDIDQLVEDVNAELAALDTLIRDDINQSGEENQGDHLEDHHKEATAYAGSSEEALKDDGEIDTIDIEELLENPDESEVNDLEQRFVEVERDDLIEDLLDDDETDHGQAHQDVTAETDIEEILIDEISDVLDYDQSRQEIAVSEDDLGEIEEDEANRFKRLRKRLREHLGIDDLDSATH